MSSSWMDVSPSPDEVREIARRCGGSARSVAETSTAATVALYDMALTQAFVAGVEWERQRCAAGGAVVPPTFGEDDDPTGMGELGLIAERSSSAADTTVLPRMGADAAATTVLPRLDGDGRPWPASGERT